MPPPPRPFIHQFTRGIVLYQATVYPPGPDGLGLVEIDGTKRIGIAQFSGEVAIGLPPAVVHLKDDINEAIAAANRNWRR